MSNKNLNTWLENTLRKYDVEDGKEYVGFYSDEPNEKLQKILAIFHKQLNSLLQYLNYRLSYGHYTAHESRELIALIEDIEKFEQITKKFNIEIKIDTDYEKIILKCKNFLCESGGSTIPEDFERVSIVDYDSIFKVKSESYVEIKDKEIKHKIKPIGEGSYAKVFKYKDTHYNKTFVIKRALNNLRPDELERFKREFDEMAKLNSPYVVEVYNFNEEKYEYTMEYMDETIEEYIYKNNTKLKTKDRINLVRQILKAFKYIHSKGVLHRDVSTKNVLVKRYDDVVVLKVSDFGLVKTEGSDLTRKGTEIKGSLNDYKSLRIEGFNNFKKEHETYALTQLIYFVMTGKSTLEKYYTTEYKNFIARGISDKFSERYKDIEELELEFNKLLKARN
ncbi:protein kinase domain-containing protein [Romboutsia sp.]|uniref:protein kinase domain-containing protein n=1 Tax=Romboutsia sp. TaxID=1965302 RepID=UPI003F3F04A3